MSVWQVIVYAIVQGITELFPISSVGHGVILPYLAGWTNVSEDPQFLPFMVLLHLGTAIALLLYFWRDWVNLLSALFTDKPRERRLLFLIVVATIPAALIGKLLENKLRELFPSATSAAFFLMINGLVLLYADRYRRRARATVQLEEVSYARSFIIGLIQAFALIPGFSRSGITMTAGLKSGLSYEDAARFSFLLATPVILGAAVLEVPKVVHSHDSHMLTSGIIGGILTGIIAFASTYFLMRYFRRSELEALRPFGRYCLVVGAVVFVLSLLHLHL